MWSWPWLRETRAGKRRGRSKRTSSSERPSNAVFDPVEHSVSILSCHFTQALCGEQEQTFNPSCCKRVSNMSKDTMRAVVFHGKLDVRLEDRPLPKIIDPTDVIVKVRYTALCGR
jgi:hypothetical protein